MICVPNIRHLICRHLTDFFPSVLQRAEVVVSLFQSLLRINQSLQFLNDCKFLLKIVGLLTLELFFVFFLVYLVDVESCFETYLKWVIFMLVAFLVATVKDKLFHFTVTVFLIESQEIRLDCNDFVLDFSDVLILDCLFKEFDEL